MKTALLPVLAGVVILRVLYTLLKKRSEYDKYSDKCVKKLTKPSDGYREHCYYQESLSYPSYDELLSLGSSPPRSSYSYPQPPSTSTAKPVSSSSNINPPRPNHVAVSQVKGSIHNPVAPPRSSYSYPQPPSTSTAKPVSSSSNINPPRPNHVAVSQVKGSIHNPVAPPRSSYSYPQPPSTSTAKPVSSSSNINPPRPNHVAVSQVTATEYTHKPVAPPRNSLKGSTTQPSMNLLKTLEMKQHPVAQTNHVILKTAKVSVPKESASVVSKIENDVGDIKKSRKNKQRNRRKKNKNNTTSMAVTVSKYPLVQSLKRHQPLGWGPIDYSLEVEFVELGPRNATFNSIKQQMGNIEPVEMYRIQNPFLWACYQLKKEECQSRCGSIEELDLWHATGEDNVDSIASGNLDWRRTKRDKFGRGVSFSNDPDYANRFCNRNSGERRALIFAKVIVGKLSKGYQSMKLPEKNTDTTFGNNHHVYVKYADNEFYPSYVAYYDNFE